MQDYIEIDGKLYEFVTKEFCVEVKSPSVTRWLGGNSNFSPQVTGYAVAMNDSVCVMGADQNLATRFCLTISSDADISKYWRRICENEDLYRSIVTNYADADSSPQLRIIQQTRCEFGDQAPTASLFLSPESNSVSNSWILEAKISEDLLQKLSQEIQQRQDLTIRIAIKWVCGLANSECDGLKVKWNLLKVTPQSEPEPLRGYISSISW